MYAVLDALDDKWDSLGRTYLLKIEQDLGPESYEYFVSWMKELKLNTTFIRFNHAETYKAADPNFVRQSICGRFDSRQSDL